MRRQPFYFFPRARIVKLVKYRVYTILEPKPGKIVEAEKNHPVLARILEPIAKRVDEFIEENIGVNLDRLETMAHPQEDYLLVSEKFPIFVVADGVTLEFVEDGTYPVPSGAGEAARIFCKRIIQEAEHDYERMSEDQMRTIFAQANKAVGEYNAAQGRTRETSNFWDHDLFAATAAYVVMKETQAYWASLCDSFVAHIDGQGKIRFMSPVCWPDVRRRRFLPPEWETSPEDERKKIIRKKYRNGVNKQGELIGYGVVTGEQTAQRYVHYGSFDITLGDIILIYTDGFERYAELPGFIDLFRKWPADLEQKVREFTDIMSRKDPANFGHERSLIAVSILRL